MRKMCLLSLEISSKLCGGGGDGMIIYTTQFGGKKWQQCLTFCMHI